MTNYFAVFPINHHDAPRFVGWGISGRQFNGLIQFLYIHIGNTHHIKILYFIVFAVTFFYHSSKSILNVMIKKAYSRESSKSKMSSFHGEQGGAVPTFTHHKAII